MDEELDVNSKLQLLFGEKVGGANHDFRERLRVTYLPGAIDPMDYETAIVPIDARLPNPLPIINELNKTYGLDIAPVQGQSLVTMSLESYKRLLRLWENVPTLNIVKLPPSDPWAAATANLARSQKPGGKRLLADLPPGGSPITDLAAFRNKRRDQDKPRQK